MTVNQAPRPIDGETPVGAIPFRAKGIRPEVGPEMAVRMAEPAAEAGRSNNAGVEPRRAFL